MLGSKLVLCTPLCIWSGNYLSPCSIFLFLCLSLQGCMGAGSISFYIFFISRYIISSTSPDTRMVLSKYLSE